MRCGICPDKKNVGEGGVASEHGFSKAFCALLEQIGNDEATD